jgi:hypothetical protein
MFIPDFSLAGRYLDSVSGKVVCHDQLFTHFEECRAQIISLGQSFTLSGDGEVVLINLNCPVIIFFVIGVPLLLFGCVIARVRP